MLSIMVLFFCFLEFCQRMAKLNWERLIIMRKTICAHSRADIFYSLNAGAIWSKVPKNQPSRVQLDVHKSSKSEKYRKNVENLNNEQQ